jgi:isoquinoline 1-oxidoreductase beta subunit
MTEPGNLAISRRNLLRGAALAGGGLLIGLDLGGGNRIEAAAAKAAGVTFAPNAFLRIGSDDKILILAKNDEMGQGIFTSIAQTIAEELEADFGTIRVEPAPAGPAYNNLAFGMQGTGGSTSTWANFKQLRQAGAAARTVLVAAAAAQWGVEPSACHAKAGRVHHAASGKSLSFGQLAEAAAALPVPADPVLKDEKDFQLIGKPVRRVDSLAKVRGQAKFSFDASLPGMAIAQVARSPYFSGKLKTFDAAAARSMPGVLWVGEVPEGVAVVAERFWQARQARAALKIEWEKGDGGGLDSEKLRQDYRQLAKTSGVIARKEGDVPAELAAGVKKLEASYEVPFLAHAPMEPLSCLVHLKEDGGAEIYTGSQFLGPDTMTAAAVLGLPADKIVFHNHFLGGAFGRRANPRADFLVLALNVAKAAKQLGRPIKTVWTREDDIRGGYYRPMWQNHLEGAINEHGKIVAWRHRLVGQSILAGTPFEAMLVKDGIDQTSVEGASTLPYDIPNLEVELHTVKSPITTLWWRSVGHSNTGFATEHFLDELARLAGRDPYKLRRTLLSQHPRHLKALELVAQKAGWESPKRPGIGRGIAVHESFKSYVAQVAEVSMGAEGRPRVEKVWCAIDCGPVVNPDIVRAQMEGAICFALSAVLYGEIKIKDGQVVNSNFHDYPLLRIHEAPKIEVYIVDSNDEMGGVGEPGVPPVAAAVANAILDLTGEPVRSLPIFPAA